MKTLSLFLSFFLSLSILLLVPIRIRLVRLEISFLLAARVSSATAVVDAKGDARGREGQDDPNPESAGVVEPLVLGEEGHGEEGGKGGSGEEEHGQYCDSLHRDAIFLHFFGQALRLVGQPPRLARLFLGGLHDLVHGVPVGHHHFVIAELDAIEELLLGVQLALHRRSTAVDDLCRLLQASACRYVGGGY